MDRKEFFEKSLKYGLCTGAMFSLRPADILGSQDTDDLEQLKQEKEFIQNWLTDLLDTIDAELDLPMKVKLIEGCGKGCYRRHSFKQEIARKGEGSLEKLIEAYHENFEAWQEGNIVHIRFGETSPGCYCPAARYREAKPNDLHCECTKATHQAIFKEALGRDVQIDILETVRRGGKTCHFLVHV